MNNIKKFFNFFLLILFVLPLITHSAGLVPCGGPGEEECTLCHLLDMIENIINFLFQNVFVYIIIGMIFYGGFLWMFSGGREENIKKGQRLMMNAIIGFVIALCAFIIVHTLFWIIAQLGGEDFTGTWFNIKCQ